MAGEIRTTVVGNLTDDPELRFTPSGAAVAAFTVAVNPRRYDRDKGEWIDDEASFVRCQAWRQLAENVVESLHKGDRVILAGAFREERWETAEGDKRTTWRLTADAIGPDLTWATASVRRAARAGELPPDDPWATASRTRPEPTSTE
jgi:single-strand DNA-binding protein